MLDFPKKWKIKKSENKIIDEDIEGLNPVLVGILNNRGIHGKENITAFLEARLSSLHDPARLPNIRHACKRIKRSIFCNEKVLIYGDYDADGIISTALLYDFYRKCGIEADTYIPDRFEEGYGISLDFIRQKEIKDRYDLIICVDCGTNAVDVRDHVISDGIKTDIIVSDHHLPNPRLLDDKVYKDNKKFIVVNPNLEGSEYPFKALSGAGVTFKMITYTLRSFKDEFKRNFDKGYLTKILDLTAIATVADLMPLLDENRVIVKHGLRFLRDSKNEGIRELTRKVLKDNRPIETSDIAFIIAPRLNACGRVKNARKALDLLLGKGEPKKILASLEDDNTRRKTLQESIYSQIREDRRIKDILKKEKALIAVSEEWHEGVLGIIASKILKEFNLPVILFSQKGEVLKGSGRSIDRFDLYKNLSPLEGLFVRFGGHSRACGITIKKENFDLFRSSFIDIVEKNLKEEDLLKEVEYDAEIGFNYIRGLLKDLERLKPYGIANPKPSFLTKSCTVMEKRSLKDGSHLSLVLKNKGILIDAVMFNIPKYKADKLEVNNNIDIIYNIEKNDWKNNCVQLKIIDLKNSDG